MTIILAQNAALLKAFESVRQEVAVLKRHVRRPDLLKYSVKEAVERMGRSRSSIYALMKDSDLTAVKERGRTYITEEEIQRWERANRT